MKPKSGGFDVTTFANADQTIVAYNFCRYEEKSIEVKIPLPFPPYSSQS
jgi:hypothetical protein